MTTRREALEAIRDRLTASLQAEELGRDLATISRELRAVWAELDALPAVDSKAPADEIARQREARRRKASGE